MKAQLDSLCRPKIIHDNCSVYMFLMLFMCWSISIINWLLALIVV